MYVKCKFVHPIPFDIGHILATGYIWCLLIQCTPNISLFEIIFVEWWGRERDQSDGGHTNAGADLREWGGGGSPDCMWAPRTWKDIFAKFSVNQWNIWWKLKNRQKVSQLDAFSPLVIVYCYLEFKLSYLKNLKLFSIRVKELSEPIVLWRKGDRF